MPTQLPISFFYKIKSFFLYSLRWMCHVRPNLVRRFLKMPVTVCNSSKASHQQMQWIRIFLHGGASSISPLNNGTRYYDGGPQHSNRFSTMANAE